MAFKASRNLRDVVDRVMELSDQDGKPGMKKSLSIKANLLTPIQPMLVRMHSDSDVTVCLKRTMFFSICLFNFIHK